MTSAKTAPVQRPTNPERLLCFSLGAEEYAIELLRVKEVIAVPEITQVPFTPPHVLGIINLRGQVISVVDLRLKLGIKAQPGPETAVIICDLAPLTLGVMVDSINYVVAQGSVELNAKPDFHSSRNSDYISAVFHRDKRLILLLAIAKALSVEDLQLLSQPPAVKKVAA